MHHVADGLQVTDEVTGRATSSPTCMCLLQHAGGFTRTNNHLLVVAFSLLVWLFVLLLFCQPRCRSHGSTCAGMPVRSTVASLASPHLNMWTVLDSQPSDSRHTQHIVCLKVEGTVSPPANLYVAALCIRRFQSIKDSRAGMFVVGQQMQVEYLHFSRRGELTSLASV